MPLVKSKSDKAFKKNIATEVKAGKPVKQAVAIAYSTKRAVKKAGGGDIRPDPSSPHAFDSDVDYYASLKKNPSSTAYRGSPRKSPAQLQYANATDFMNPAERRLKADQERVRKAWEEHAAKNKKATGGKVKKMCGGGW